jgi:hypothetical protein
MRFVLIFLELALFSSSLSLAVPPTATKPREILQFALQAHRRLGPANIQSTIVAVGLPGTSNSVVYQSLVQNDISHFRFTSTYNGGCRVWCAGRTAVTYLIQEELYTTSTLQIPGNSPEYLISGRLDTVRSTMKFPGESGFFERLQVSRATVNGTPCYKISSPDPPLSPTGTPIPFMAIVIGVQDGLIHKMNTPLPQPYHVSTQWLYYDKTKPFPSEIFRRKFPKGAREWRPSPLAPMVE